jgi:hypothetical protein
VQTAAPPSVKRAGASGNEQEQTKTNDSGMKEPEVPVLTLPLVIGYWLFISAPLTATGSAVMRFASGISLTPYFADC